MFRVSHSTSSGQVSRGKRQKEGNDEAIPCILESQGDEKTFRRNWARLIQKIYEVDPLICPKCQGIMRIAKTDQRIALTRDQEILNNKAIQSYRPGSIFPDEQIREVLSAFDLRQHSRPFSRCLDCNGEIIPVNKDSVISQVPPRSGQVMKQFWQCQGCGKIYWHGSHYDRMEGWIKGLR
jgi:uncharacterized protein with PIN domain